MNLFDGRLNRYGTLDGLERQLPEDKPCPECKQLKGTYGLLCSVCHREQSVMDEDMKQFR